jgi:RNA polymerase sigma factor (TIGR02999 family)
MAGLRCCQLAMNEVTRILEAIKDGDKHAAAELLPLVYNELRRLAAEKLSRERPGQTLAATALVHEAYVRLVDCEQPQRWDSRGHFFAAAAEAMRRILIENARRKASLKRGGGYVRRVLIEDQIAGSAENRHEDLLALDEALTKLAKIEPQTAKLVELRYFAGLTNEQAAEILGMSPRTAKRAWTYARAWLRRELGGED